MEIEAKKSPVLARGCILYFLAWVVLGVLTWGLWRSTPHCHVSTSTQTQLKALEIAIKAYREHYGGCLLAIIGAPAQADLEVTHRIIGALLADKSEFNPDSTRFVDLKRATSGKEGAWKDESGQWQLRDAWGTTIRMRFSGTGEQPSPRDPSEVLTAKYILWSAGPDQDFDTWRDNVTSWK